MYAGSFSRRFFIKFFYYSQGTPDTILMEAIAPVSTTKPGIISPINFRPTGLGSDSLL
jgi:hypothetical protein